MDVAQTIQAILESQLRAEKRADRADERMDRADERMDRADERADRAEKRADRFEKQINAIGDLVRGGLKFIDKSNREFKFKIEALTDAQNRTEAAMRKSDEKFNRWLEQISRKGPNGHRK